MIFKQPQVSPSTFCKDYTKQQNHIRRFPSQSLDDAISIRDYLLANLTPDAAKRCLSQLKACCDWAVEDSIIETNPFSSMQIRVPKGLTDDEDVNPFSKEERDRIIQMFEADPHYKHYASYVRFLFFTGARPSEVIGLQWKHITESVIRFRQAVVVSNKGLILKEGLKTQHKRDFPITPCLTDKTKRLEYG